MKAIFILGLSLIGGVGSFLFLNRIHSSPVSSWSPQTVQGTNPRGDQNDAPDGTAELQEQVRQLASEVATLRRQVASGPIAPPSATIEKESAPAIDMHGPEGRAKAKAEREERIAAVEAEFRSEGHDPRWSAPMEATIRDAVSAANFTQGSLQNVQCQTKTCRIELAVQDVAPFSQEIPNLIARLTEKIHGSAMDFIDNPGGGHTGVLYLFR